MSIEIWPFKRGSRKGSAAAEAAQQEVFPEGLPQTPEAFMESVDLEVLNGIFDELVRKSEAATGVRNTGHRLERRNIIVAPGATKIDGEESEDLGSANISQGTIAVAWDSAAAPAEAALKAYTTLVHEAAHIRGGSAHDKWDRVAEGRKGFEVGHSIVRGVRQSRYEGSMLGRTERDSFLSMNEAITDALSHEVLVEYFRRTGTSKYLSDAASVRALNKGTGYPIDRFALEVLMKALAKRLDVSRDDIWRGFVQAYMSSSVELWGLLHEIEITLAEDSNASALLVLLSKDKSIGAQGDEAVEKALSTIRKGDGRQKGSHTEDALALLEVALEPFSNERLQNVLKLR